VSQALLLFFLIFKKSLILSFEMFYGSVLNVMVLFGFRGSDNWVRIRSDRYGWGIQKEQEA